MNINSAITIDNVLKAYFLQREDAGAYFDVKSAGDLCDFEKFLIKENYIQHFNKDVLNEALNRNLFEDDDARSQLSLPLGETDADYVARRYSEFFKFSGNKTDLQELTAIYTHFRKLHSNATLASFKRFSTEARQEMKYLMDFEKNQIGKGEFAMFLLFPDATKVASQKKGDIHIPEGTFEIKKEGKRGENLRFGTNIHLDSIAKLRTLTFSLKDLLFMETNKEIQTWAKAWDVTFSGSEASITIEKLKELYKFVNSLRDYCLSVLQTKNIDITDNEMVSFKLYNSSGPVSFQIPSMDVRRAMISDRRPVPTTIARVTNASAAAEEIYVFCKKAMRIIQPFLKQYSAADVFASQTILQLKRSYATSGVKIMIIDFQYNVLLYPDDVEFEFYSVNQWTRPQVKIKR